MNKLRRPYKILVGLVFAILITLLGLRFLVSTKELILPYSTVLEASNGQLLGAKIAPDGQWRFPPISELNQKMEDCILLFEDEYFYSHPGFNPFAIFRAFKANIKAKKVVQGGSTITMQLARLYYQNAPRNFKQKLLEFILSLHLELKYSKEEILNQYLSLAPFGGNVVGAETAAWRYFNRPLSNLSWGETAALAVLPNAPSIIYPGKNRLAYRAKRDFLLDKLHSRGILSLEEASLAKLEPLPEKPLPLPNNSQHLLDRIAEGSSGTKVKSTINEGLQNAFQQEINQFTRQYAFNGIHNAAAILIDNNSSQILAYIGNSMDANTPENYVDVIRAPRSTGSILKPLLFADMLGEGELLPNSLIADIPTYIAGYIPKNYYLEWDGAVPAREALYRSLNIPFVRLLRQHGLEKFHAKLQKAGLDFIRKNADHYGLTLILGGAECSLEQIGRLYSGMARQLNSYHPEKEQCDTCYTGIVWDKNQDKKSFKTQYHPAAIYETFQALLEAERPNSATGFKSFSSSQKIAWKTGTSFGNRDAWAIGVNPKYTLAVWVGNADGEGKAGLTGLQNAAPILFKLFEKLDDGPWFNEPLDAYTEIDLCTHSGYPASRHCPDTKTSYCPNTTQQIASCSYHIPIQLDKTGRYRVDQDCYQGEIVNKSWFVLPAAQAFYYAKKNATYKPLPPYLKGCEGLGNNPIDFIYPQPYAKIFVPIVSNGERGKPIFNVAHQNPNIKLYWHLDQKFIGTTKLLHEMAIAVDPGKHHLMVVDELGNEKRLVFTVLE